MATVTTVRAEWRITVRKACKRFGENVLFRDLSLSLEPGCAVRVTGENGSGKTQLLYSLCGLASLDAGDVEITDSQVVTAVPSGLYNRDNFFRFVPALLGNLAQLKIAEFVHVVSRNLDPLSLAARSKAVTRSFARLSAELEAATGRELAADMPVSCLSIGQQKRLSLAATLVSDYPPKVLAIDEPLAALDETGIRQMVSALAAIRSRGVALVIAEHRPEIETVGFDTVIALPYGVRGNNGQVPTELPDVPADVQPATCLSVKNMIAGYPRAQVRCEQMEIRRGEIAIVSGVNGSGKTGWLKALAGIPPTTLDGTLEFDGALLPNLEKAMWEGKVRYMAQDRDNFLSLRVKEAVLAASQEHAPQAMIGELVDFIGPKKRIATLSSGDRALVGLMQTLAVHPQLALLDEPFANVDGPNRQRMLGLICHARRDFGTAFLIVEHGTMALPGTALYTLHEDEAGRSINRSQ